jgi:glycosylphosphatidylinositol phospholipase D
MSPAFYFPLEDMKKIHDLFDKACPTNAAPVTIAQMQAATRIEYGYCQALRATYNSEAARKFVETNFYPYAAYWSPFLVENFESYAVGGVDDNAVWISRDWPVLASWFRTPPDPKQFDFARALYCLRFRTTASGPGTCDRGFMSEEMKRWDVAMPEVTSQQLGDATVYECGAGSPTRPGGSEDPPYVYTGTSLAVSRGGRRTPRGDFNRDGIDDLVIGSPGASVLQGSVTIAYGKKEPGPVVPDVTIRGPESYGRFGAAVAVLDFNADGLDDLAVGAPAVSDAAFPNRGAVYVYFGQPAGGVSQRPDLVLRLDAPYAGFGSVLATGDFDGDGRDDLLVGAPALQQQRQSGAVVVYLSSTQPGKPAWTGRGTAPAERYGSAMTIARFRNGTRMLLVSANGAKLARTQEVGQIYGYDLTSEPAIRFTLTGATMFERAGASTAVGEPRGDGQMLFAFGSLGNSGGGVMVVALESLKGDLSTSTITPLLRIEGDQRFARFGWRVAFGDVDNDGIDDLVVSEPFRVEKVGVDAGSISVFRGGATFPTGTISRVRATWTFTSPRWRSQFGRSLALLDVRNPEAKAKIAAGAPMDSAIAEMGGSVQLVKAGN